jgi:uncharacterized secreted protein with C-terminal beta-propeller domain
MRKQINILLILAMLLTVSPVQLLAQSSGNFSDVQERDLKYDAIQYLKSEQVIEGYQDGTFKPNNRINRAEFTKIIIASLYTQQEIDNCLAVTNLSYPDVPQDSWFAPYVCVASQNGIVSGYPDGTFRPADNINFAEASKIISESFDTNSSTLTESDEWYSNYVASLQAASAIPSTIDSVEIQITRGDMSEMIYRLDAEVTSKPTQTLSNLTSQLGTINSCDALKERYESFDFYPYPYMFEDDMIMMEDSSMEFESESSMEAPEAGSGDMGGGQSDSSVPEFSETNVQEAGVDEPDVVKTNGTHVYTINSNFQAPAVQITSATDGELNLESSIVFKEETPRGMFLQDGQLIVLTNSNYFNYYPLAANQEDSILFVGAEESIQEKIEESQVEEPDFEITQDSLILPPYRDESRVGIYIFDITDTSNPTLKRQLKVEGNYQNARLIQDQLLFVTNYAPYSFPNNDEEELLGEDLIPEITYGTNEPEKVSECTDIQYLPNHSDMSFLVISSLDTSDQAARVDSQVLIATSSDLYVSPNHMYLTQPKYNYSRFSDLSEDDLTTTNIFKFDIQSEGTELEGVMNVPGTPLNQFSMSEYQGDFRITTTLDNWTDLENQSSNNLYVFDQNLNRVGVLENLAPGERIYSTRFIGDRAYMVTFRQIDPLFVIDLSNSSKPEVLGELKIPGFSDYLHPYDENYLLGFGKEATLDGETQGMKVALFDVEDPTNPQQLHTFLIGDRGTDSELLRNHRALLFSKEKNILSFPVSIYEQTEPGVDTWGKLSFVGALNLGLDIDSGFELQGKYTHISEGIDPENPWDYDYNQAIQRVIYIGDDLYTISNSYIQSHSLTEDVTIDSEELIK